MGRRRTLGFPLFPEFIPEPGEERHDGEDEPEDERPDRHDDEG
jgi:hypothetical protein